MNWRFFSIPFWAAVLTVSLYGCSEGDEVVPVNTTITYINTTVTAVTLTVNGQTQIIESGEEKTFVGKPNETLVGTAFTSGTTTTGSQVGGKLSWMIDDAFPPSGNLDITLEVSADFVFLEVTNKSAYTINKVYVNYGLASQSLDNLSIPNDQNAYSIGYYKAFGNSTIRLEAGGVHWYAQYLPLPGTVNQKYGFIAN